MFSCPDSTIFFQPESRRYGLIVHDGGSSFIEIQFCPWCGSSLQQVRQE
ncbi:DUF6980 family protein [Leptonema illini]